MYIQDFHWEDFPPPPLDKVSLPLDRVSVPPWKLATNVFINNPVHWPQSSLAMNFCSPLTRSVEGLYMVYCIFMHMFIHIYVYMYMYTYMYIHVHYCTPYFTAVNISMEMSVICVVDNA